MDTLRCPWSKPGCSHNKHPHPCIISSPHKDLWAPDCSPNLWDQKLAPMRGQAWLSLEPEIQAARSCPVLVMLVEGQA